MAFNLGSFLQGGAGGYKFVKDMQVQEDERLRKKNQDVRDDVKAGREDAAYGIEQAYKQDLQNSINQWKDVNGFSEQSSAQTTPAVAAQTPTTVPPAASSVMPQSTVPAQPALPMAAGITAPQAQPTQPQATTQAPRPNANQMLDLQSRMAFVGLKHGQTEGVDKLQQTMEKMRDEGFDKSLEMMKQGRYQEAFDRFNSIGKEKREFVSAKDGIYVTPAGDKIPTKLVTAKLADGTTTVLDTAKMEFQLMKAKDLVEMGQKSREVGAKEKIAEADKSKAATEAAKGVKPPYKVELNEVASAFSEPAVDRNGKPITNPITGGQMMNRNQAKERDFMVWMQRNGITDTNEGLAKYLAQPATQPPAAKVPQRPLSAF